MVHRYADDTVDGEFTIQVPRGTAVEDIIKQLRDAFGVDPEGLGYGYWLSVGQRYVIKEDDEVYRRHKGMNEINTYYSRMRTSKIIPVFGSARTKMTRGAERKFRRKAESVFIRLHWNPDNEKPRR